MLRRGSTTPPVPLRLTRWRAGADRSEEYQGADGSRDPPGGSRGRCLIREAAVALESRYQTLRWCREHHMLKPFAGSVGQMSPVSAAAQQVYADSSVQMPTFAVSGVRVMTALCR